MNRGAVAVGKQGFTHHLDIPDFTGGQVQLTQVMKPT